MTFLELFNYMAAVFMVLFGLYTLIIRLNLIRKIIGMAILQTGVILFYVSISFKSGAAIPIVENHGHQAIDVSQYANPLPHALMLTAIVVGVSTLGVALTLVLSIYRQAGSLEEDEILQKVEEKNEA